MKEVYILKKIYRPTDGYGWNKIDVIAICSSYEKAKEIRNNVVNVLDEKLKKEIEFKIDVYDTDKLFEGREIIYGRPNAWLPY